MKSISYVLIVSQMAVATVAANPATYGEERSPRLAAASAVSGAVAILSDPTVSYYETVLKTSPIRGGFGEGHMNQFVSRYVRGLESVRPITARLAPQGIDGLFIAYGPSGIPSELIVVEAKYGSSRLIQTKDGIQMGRPWRSARLFKVADAYKSVAEQVQQGLTTVEKLQNASRPQRVEIRLASGKAAVFWRRDATELWKFAGDPSKLQEAGEQMGLLSDLIERCARGTREYKAMVWRVQVEADSISWVAKDARGLTGAGAEGRLPVIRAGTIPLRGAELESLKRLGTSQIAEMIVSKEPTLPLSEARVIAKKIAGSSTLQQTLTAGWRRAELRVVQASVLAGMVASACDVSVGVIGDYLESGEVNADVISKRGAIAFGAGAVGAFAGQKATLAILKSAAASSARGLAGVPSATMFAATGAGIALGGSVAGAVAAYAGYVTGVMDLRTAHRAAIQFTAGSAAMGGFYYGTTTLVAAYGTASTGTAISALSGIAAENATMAVIGGGTLASGGFGAVGGAVIVSGGVAAIGLVVGAAVATGFSYLDERADMQRVALTVDRLSRKEHLVRVPAVVAP